MFGIVDSRQTEYATGIYFPEYPTPPIRKQERFKYVERDVSANMKDVVTNLSSLSTQKTIVTSYKIAFKVEGYVLLGNELYRIMDVQSTIKQHQSARIINCPLKEQTLFLNRVSNVSGISI